MKAIVNGIQVEGTPKEVNEFIGMREAKAKAAPLKINIDREAIGRIVREAAEKIERDARRVRPYGYSL